MTSPRTFKVGILIGTTRVARIGPQVATFLLDILHDAGTTQYPTAQSRITLEAIDIQDFQLPMFNEPGLMNRITRTEDYLHAHTRAWSAHISTFDAFVFLSAQRNWGIPAELKNAIDYLFHEWKGKPVMVVSYGGHGGVQAAEQIKIVTGAMGMRVVQRMVNMKFPSKEHLDRGLFGEDMELDARSDEGTWAGYRGEVADVFWNDMVGKMLLEGEGETRPVARLTAS
jgi:NAD(P)H-dependent FMN reductase